MISWYGDRFRAAITKGGLKINELGNAVCLCRFYKIYRSANIRLCVLYPIRRILVGCGTVNNTVRPKICHQPVHQVGIYDRAFDHIDTLRN